jgi:hypothetical protein
LTFSLIVSDGTNSSGPAVTHVIVQAPAAPPPSPPPPPPPAAPNLALVATVTASSQNAATGQLAAAAIDGVVEGYTSGDYQHEWATAGQGAGAWIQLTWPTAQAADTVVLYDRPNGDDRILAGTLTFSDGFSVPVGPLDNAGAATTVSFTARYFLWVRLTVTQVSGSTGNVGLAEFEVRGAAASGNQPPVAAVSSPLVASPGQTVTLDGSASYDPEGAALVYEWTQTLGPAVALSSHAAASPTFTMPTGTDPLAFELVVGDGVSPSDPATVSVTAPPPTPPQNLAREATATASSQNTSTRQLASSAIDGVAEGYSHGDYTHEWATTGQAAGAWLRLDWTGPRTIASVVLYDRPNGDDQVLAGVLEFGDGTTEMVGALDNAGAGVTVRFAARTVTNVRFRVTQASGSTSNVGLAEFEVFP